MNIIELKLTDIHPYEKNPRINRDAVDKVAESIKQFGFKVPIVVDKDHTIVCGHTRYKASKKLRLKTVPCIIADDLSDEQIRAYRLADNKTAEFAEWDDSMLMAELENIVDIDMDVFGFDLDLSVEPVEEDKPEREDLSDSAGSCYEIVIECADEDEQMAVYERLTGEGLTCRVLTL